MSDFPEQTELERRPKFGRTVLDDISRGDFKVTMKRDWQDVLQFYLDEEDLLELDEMGSFKRWLVSTWWLAKSMFFKLNPTRRIILLTSVVLFMYGGEGIVAPLLGSFVGLLLILILELKDKLLAQNELASGRAVQFALMPDRAPQLDGWDIWLYTRPANDVGGDLVDYIRTDEEHMGLALGDVAGKGLSAALFMAKLQATIRAIAPNHRSLSKLGQEINHIFWRDKLPNRFASLLYAEIGSQSGRMNYINAGHLPPIILDHAGVRTLPRGNTAIGLMDGAPFDERQVDFEQDDVMVIYSDGVSEARSEDGVFFGDERLVRILRKARGQSASAVGAVILSEVADFVGDARPHDDLSIIVIRRRA